MEQQSWREMMAFVGKRVTVVLDYDDPAARTTGTLVSLSDDGEAIIDADEGRWSCWPVLQVIPHDR